MKKAFVFGLGLAFLAVTGLVQADEMKDKHLKEDHSKILECEVVDVACYLGKGAHGPDHTACAAKCISEGGMLALLCEGKLCVPVTPEFHQVRTRFVSKGGEKVKVRGNIVDKDGTHFLILADMGKKK
ncbi:MAG TPA: hypothetical protein VHE12_04005 [bacterium]|nr:hypothetical protein [bacterium]